MGWEIFQKSFEGCSNLTNVDGGKTNLVTNMINMFYGASNANPDVSNWDVILLADAGGMFRNASIATPDVSSWNTINLQGVGRMFQNAILASPVLSGWDVSQITNMGDFLNNTSTTVAEYSQLLINMDNTNSNPGASIGANGIEYNASAAAARAALVTNVWTINDAGPE